MACIPDYLALMTPMAPASRRDVREHRESTEIFTNKDFCKGYKSSEYFSTMIHKDCLKISKNERGEENQEKKKQQEEVDCQEKKNHQEEEEHQEKEDIPYWDEEEGLTIEEVDELTKLHEEAMAPSQEEEDWLLLIMIKEERNNLANKYFPRLSNYTIEDTCKVCNRYFYKKGNL